MVTLELQINEQNIISTNALILKDANFSYDLILGRDLLAESQIDLKQKTITLNGEQICFLEKHKKQIERDNKVQDTSCLLNEVVNLRNRKKKCKFKVKAFSAEKVRDKFQLFHEKDSQGTVNVHCDAITIPANSINVLNAFCRDIAAGEYIMPKHSLRNGILIAESIVKINENSRGLALSCAVLPVNVSNNDVNLSASAIWEALSNMMLMMTVSFLFQAMGNSMTTYDVSALVDVLTHQSNLRSDDAKHWGERMKEYVAEQKRLHSTIDLLPDRLTDVSIIISFFCVILCIVTMHLQTKLRALETQSVSDSTFVKHRLLGLQMENLRQVDNTRRSRRELMRDSEEQQI